MRKMILLLVGLALALGFLSAPTAHAEIGSCPYPFVGEGADVSIVVTAGGGYCDGPTEINWSHSHCESGGANVNIGVLGFASAGGFNLGGFGASGIGMHKWDCKFRCPDGTEAPFPNPPAAWIKHLVLDPKNNDCDQHMGIRGPSSTPLPNELPGNIAPGEGAPPGVAVPAAPGALPAGQSNPPALPGPPPPTPPPGAPPAADEGSPIAPGSPIPMP